MTDYVYSMQGLTKVHPPDKKVVEDVYLSFLPGAKIGVIGANGSGKSTLLRIMAGLDTQFNGEARPKPGIKVGYFAQEPNLDGFEKVSDYIDTAVSNVRELIQRFEDLSMKLGESMSDEEMNKVIEQHGKIQDEIEAKDGWNLDHNLEMAMEALRLPPADAAIKDLSGGERRRVALCKVLLERPDMLLLDEPTNHLDAESVAWLEQHLAQYPGCIVSITHDRYFLDNVAEWILELDRGRAIPFKGNYTAWLEQKEKRLADEAKQDAAQKRKLAHELEWVRSAPKARHAKSKARLKAYDEMLQAQGKAKHSANEIFIPAGPRLGDIVLDCKEVTKAFDDKLLFSDLSLRVPRGAIVGIVGPNGAGKTTFFRMITGAEFPDKGDVKLGDTVQLAYVDQMRDELRGDKTVWQEISEEKDNIELGKTSIPSRAYVSWFNFKGSDQQKYVKQLSGGERNRVHLAKVLKSGANVILLDEPTNDLDVETLRSLEEALLEFPGSAFIVSHDRWFLDRIATHILAFEGDSQVVWFDGSYTEYEADRKKRLGDKADRPHKVRYRKFSTV